MGPLPNYMGALITAFWIALGLALGLGILIGWWFT